MQHQQAQSTHSHSDTNVYMAIEVSNKKWRLAFSDGSHEREVTILARQPELLIRQIQRAKEKFNLPADTPVYSCYEAGRDGFWIHRMLVSKGVNNIVVDPASIEVSRRMRRTKTDRLDAGKLRQMLIRHWAHGEKKIWSVLHVPNEEQEAARRSHREAERLKKEKRQHMTRIKALLALHGLTPRTAKVDPQKMRDWKGEELRASWSEEIKREQERLAMVEEQLAVLEKVRGDALKDPRTKEQRQAAQLAKLKGLGQETAWNLSYEFFGWRDFKNRRQVGSAAGMTGCPYSSGDSNREQGISKAGNKRVRVWMTELGWRWLKWQPRSVLSKWFEARFGASGKRQRRVGIVALGRKLLVELWKYLETGQAPEGAFVAG